MAKSKDKSSSAERLGNRARSRLAACVCIIGGVGAWIGDAEVLQAAERYKVHGKAYDKPYFINYLIHCGYLLWLLVWALWTLINRCNGIKPAQHSRQYYIKFFTKLFFFNLLYLAGGYTWTISLPITSVAANTAIYNSSCIFVFVLSVFILREAVTWLKCLAVAIAVGGIFLISFAPQDPDAKQNNGTPFGYAMLAVSTLSYAVTEVFYGRYFAGQTGGNPLPTPINSPENSLGESSRGSLIEQYHRGLTGSASLQQGDEDTIVDVDGAPVYVTTLKDNFWFLGMIGLFNLLTCWPGIFIVNATGAEPFEMPDTHTWKSIAGNVGLDALFQLCFLTGIYLSSPLFMAVGLLLTIPVSIVVDKLAHDTLLPPLALGGVGAIVLGFALLNYAEYSLSRERTKATTQVVETNYGSAHYGSTSLYLSGGASEHIGVPPNASSPLMAHHDQSGDQFIYHHSRSPRKK